MLWQLADRPGVRIAKTTAAVAGDTPKAAIECSRMANQPQTLSFHSKI